MNVIHNTMVEVSDRRGLALFARMAQLLLLAVCLAAPSGAYAERLKDISVVSGIRDNQLVGYGLVIGLNGTGDKSGSMSQALANMFERLGIHVNAADVRPKNVAAVMVTAEMPTFIKTGSRLDVTVSSIAEAKSLQGGTLLLAPLRGPDGVIYAVAQGPVSIGGFSAGGRDAGVSKNHPTVGRVPGGALVEREVPISFDNMSTVEIVLSTQDFTTVQGVVERLNETLGGAYTRADGPGSVQVTIPEAYQGRVIEFLALLETVEVSTDLPAKVVINEKTGTVVLGERVMVSPVALSHGSLTVEIKTGYDVSQPAPFSPTGETVVTPDTRVAVAEGKASLIPVSGTDLGKVVQALNSLGVTPRDLIAILQALKASGALKAELEIL